MNFSPSSVLVVRLSSLGDVILTAPALESIKAAWPGCRVSLLVKDRYADVFAAHPAVDEILSFESRGLWGWLAEFRRRPFDVYVDLHDTWRSRVWGAFGKFSRRTRYDKRAWERRRLVWTKRPSPRLASGVPERYLEALEGLGVKPVTARPRLFVSDGGRLPPEWEGLLGKGRFIGLAPGATHATKRWPAERFAEAADGLREELERADPGTEVKILLFGASSDRPVAEEVLKSLRGPVLSVVGRTSVKELLLLAKRCIAFLTNDSGLMHAASALGVPTVAVFGPTVEAFGFFPDRSAAEVVENTGLPCRPCTLHGGPRCPLGHFRCMREISVDRVREALRRVLEKGRRAPARP